VVVVAGSPAVRSGARKRVGAWVLVGHMLLAEVTSSGV